MPEEISMLAVRIPESVRARLEIEALRSRRTRQDIVIDSLNLYFAAPGPLAGEISACSNKRAARRAAWEAYMDQMPDENVQLMGTVMRLDLLQYRSSRRKKPNA